MALESQPPGPQCDIVQRLAPSSQPVLQQTDDLLWVVGWNVRAESGADANAAVDNEERHDRIVRLWLHQNTVIIQILQNARVLLAEQVVRDGLQVGVDVPGAGRILAAQQTSAELPNGLQQVDIVGTDECLCHAGDGRSQRCLTVVIGRVL